MTQAVVQVRNIVARSGFANPLTLEVLVTDEDYLKVYADTTLLDNGPDYTITGIGDPNGISIEIIGAEDVDEYVGVITFTALYDPPLDQQGSLAAGGVLGRAFESALDQQNRRLQALGDRVERSLKVNVNIDGDIVLDPVDGLVPMWDEDTQQFLFVETPSSAAAEAAAAAAAASAAAAAIDAGEAAASAAAAALAETAAELAETNAETAEVAAEAAQAAAEAAAAAAANKLPLAGGTMTGPIGFTHQASPANPAAGVLSVFAKNDNKVYTRTSAGVETEIGGAAADDSITNAKLANMATATIKGRETAGTGDPEDLTPAQARNVMDAAPYVADRTALKALDTTKDTVAILTEDKRAGVFQWKTGNYSAHHALDTQEAMYVKATAIASTAGSWVRTGVAMINAEWAGAVHDNATDDTTALNKFFALLPFVGLPGFVPAGQYSITNTINIGDGTSTTRSTTNGFTCTFETMGNPLGILNPFMGIDKVGAIFNWDGSAGGTMFQVNGPIHGLRFIGALQLDGDRSAAKGFRALSMSFSQFDAITAMHCTGTNIELDVQAATTIAGDANGITTASNEFQEINCGSPDQANSICMSWDGYKVVGGQDVTNCRFRRVTTYIDLTNGIGLYWGYSDFNIIDQLVGIGYGAVSGSPAGVHLAGTATPFNAPDLNVIKQASVGHNVSVTASGSPGNNYIEIFSLNDSSVMPSGIPGISGRTVSATDAEDRQTFGDWEQHKISVPGDDDGLYLVVGATEIGAIVRATNDVRYRSFQNHLFDGDVIADAGRFKADRTSADAILEAATTTSGHARLLLTNNGNQGYELYADRTNNLLKILNGSFTFLSMGAATGDVTAKQKLLADNPTGGIGYATGAGGAVTQGTSKSTGVTLNKVCGQITTHNAALAANTTVIFTVTDSAVAATDVVRVTIGSGGTAGAYLVWVSATAAGSFNVAVRNITAGSLSEALVLNFSVQKAVAA